VIDYSNEIFNAVAVDLRSVYEGIRVVGEYVATPTVFPTVTLDETQNVPTHLDSARQNKYARVQYRAQIFTNSEGKRTQARKIYGTLDAIMQELGFVCVTYTTTPAIYNSEVYCITATYEGVIDANGMIYRG
jgi:hypothetical protein